MQDEKCHSPNRGCEFKSLSCYEILIASSNIHFLYMEAISVDLCRLSSAGINMLFILYDTEMTELIDSEGSDGWYR